ncbi:MAG: hypothetical protein M1118_13555 [Chloroflexi bacterium]|nr:hypothetical protein [Chloroflexota bacterium]
MALSIVGGGAVGSFIAARLTMHKVSCELVVKPEHVSAFRHGVHVASKGAAKLIPVRVTTEPSSENTRVLVTVKLPDLIPTLERLSKLPEHPKRSYLLAQNGLSNLDRAATVVSLDQLCAAVVLFGVTTLDIGHVELSQPGPVVVGTPIAGERTTADGWASVLRPALKTMVVQDIRAVQRVKLLANLTNGLAAATGLSLQELYKFRGGALYGLRLLKEGLDCFHRLAVPLVAPDPRVELALQVVPERLALPVVRLAFRGLARSKPIYLSALQSILRGRPHEVNDLNGEIVRIARRIQRPVPYNSTVVKAVESVIQSGRPPCFIPLTTLLEEAQQAARELRGW